MPRTRDEARAGEGGGSETRAALAAARVAEATRLYVDECLSTRAVAAQMGVDPATIRRWLADVMRPRGPRPAIDPDEVRKARKGRRQSWDQVARDLGVSKTGARKAYRARYGDAGLVDRHAHLSPKQAAELRALWDAVPPPATGGTGHSMDTSEGRRVRDLLMHYRKAGVACTELGEAIGVTGSHVSALTIAPR